MNGISKSISVAKVDDADAIEEPHVEEEAELQSLHDEVHVPGQQFEYVTEVEDVAAIQDEEAGEALQPIEGEADIEEEVKQSTTRSGRSVKTTKDSNFVYSTNTDDAEVKAYMEELAQMFKEKGVLIGQHYHKIKNKRKIIRAFMFLKKKYLPDGSFDKVKGRLVGDGRLQDRLIDRLTSSPTAAFSSVLIALKYAAVKKLKLMKIDIKGAFLNADLNELVYLLLDKKTTEMAIAVMPELKEFVHNGRLYCLVKKALYGLVQSARLWYECMKGVLIQDGFTETEPCVFKKGDGIIILYVDDLLVLGDDGFLDHVRSLMIEKFEEITEERSTKLNYLGMSVEILNDGVKLSMTGYTDELIKDSDIKECTVPMGKNVFESDERAAVFGDKEYFHTCTAKLLYLSKRVRADILLPVSFLCTRVNSPTVEDNEKLNEVLGYLKATKSKHLFINESPDIELEVYVDASFSSHTDGKGHSGCVMLLGGSMVYASSRKQKICTKDSTEAEVVALSDNLVQIESISDFVNKLFGKTDMTIKSKIKPVVLQDITSTIRLITENCGKQRTKHLAARLGCIREAAKEWVAKFIPTDLMLADVLTKTKSKKMIFHSTMATIMGMSRAKYQWISNVDSRLEIEMKGSHRNRVVIDKGALVESKSGDTMRGI